MDKFDTSSELSEDEEVLELQKAFKEGRIKPGLNVEVTTKEKVKVNDKPGLKAKLEQLNESSNLDWIERLDLTVATSDLQQEEVHNGIAIFNDDFRLESKISDMVIAGVSVALKELKKMKIAITRPPDYYAEMLKSDEHMKKVRDNIVKKQAEIDAKESARKLKHQKRFGKQMQVQAELAKAKEKRDFKKTVELHKKGIGKDIESTFQNKKQTHKKHASKRTAQKIKRSKKVKTKKHSKRK